MTMPLDLVLVRHGQSEGNAAKRRSEKGDTDALRTVYTDRHTRSFRCTALGARQGANIGRWIVREFFDGSTGFDRFYTSDYIRAVETAGLLALPGAKWYVSTDLTERDWGVMNVQDDERDRMYAKAMRDRDIEPFYWRPANGESFMALCQRLRWVLDTLHRECADKRVIIVCHGEVMWAFRVMLERMSQERFRELHLSPAPEHKIHNCQVLHYTRRDPETKALAKHLTAMRAVRVNEEQEVWTSGWQPIVRPTYTNEELLERAARYPALLA